MLSKDYLQILNKAHQVVVSTEMLGSSGGPQREKIKEKKINEGGNDPQQVKVRRFPADKGFFFFFFFFYNGSKKLISTRLRR